MRPPVCWGTPHARPAHHEGLSLRHRQRHTSAASLGSISTDDGETERPSARLFRSNGTSRSPFYQECKPRHRCSASGVRRRGAAVAADPMHQCSVSCPPRGCPVSQKHDRHGTCREFSGGEGHPLTDQPQASLERLRLLLPSRYSCEPCLRGSADGVSQAPPHWGKGRVRPAAA